MTLTEAIAFSCANATRPLLMCREAADRDGAPQPTMLQMCTLVTSHMESTFPPVLMSMPTRQQTDNRTAHQLMSKNSQLLLLPQTDLPSMLTRAPCGGQFLHHHTPNTTSTHSQSGLNQPHLCTNLASSLGRTTATDTLSKTPISPHISRLHGIHIVFIPHPHQ